MVQVISNLGSSDSSFNSTTVIRPVFVSIGFAVVVPIIARFVVKPLTSWLRKRRANGPDGYINCVFKQSYTALLLHTGILITMITAANYCGTSSLFAAYLAGAAITWWDDKFPSEYDGETPPQERPQIQLETLISSSGTANSSRQRSSFQSTAERRISRTPTRGGVNSSRDPDMKRQTGTQTFKKFFSQPLNRILKPFFFVRLL